MEKELNLQQVQLIDIFLKNGLRMERKYYREVVWN